jgi:ubiquinone/menaquinone biosynthesis C-methylase UbiE
MIACFNAELLALVDQAAPASVLEIGCGEGFVLRYLAERRPGICWAGLDLSAPAIGYARAQCPSSVTLGVGSIYYLPMPPAAFDLVICSEVLEHLADAPAALAELQRVSRSHVLITAPREPYFRILVRLAVWLRLGRDPGHVQFWTGRDFRRMMRQHFPAVTFAASSLYQLALGHCGIKRP